MATHTQSANGLLFDRRYTRDDINVFDQFEYDYRSSVIRNPSGEIVFEMNKCGSSQRMEPDCDGYPGAEIFP